MYKNTHLSGLKKCRKENHGIGVVVVVVFERKSGTGDRVGGGACR